MTRTLECPRGVLREENPERLFEQVEVGGLFCCCTYDSLRHVHVIVQITRKCADKLWWVHLTGPYKGKTYTMEYSLFVEYVRSREIHSVDGLSYGSVWI